MSAIVARGPELARVEGFLDEILSGPTAMLLQGESGAGKTTLWNAALEAGQARGYRVLSCRPVEAESLLAFAALGDLFEGALERLDPPLPGPQRQALEVAILLADPEGPPPDQRAVSVASLGLLRSLSERSPVLVGVDDPNAMDLPSARVLEFALRRLENDRVGFVAGLRAGEGVPLSLDQSFSEARLHRLAVGPLDCDALDEMFRSRLGRSLARPVLRQIEGASAGNPLFALEIAKGILRGDVSAEPGERLPVPDTLQELIRDRLEGLSADVREVLAAASAVSDPTLEMLQRAAPTGTPTLRAVREAIRTGVVEPTERAIEFSHPLFASTLYHDVPAKRRRALHRRLADLVPTLEERALHLALAATGPDAAVAAVLDQAARRAAARGAPEAAADLCEQASRLTPKAAAAEAARRRMEAAEYHFAAGDTARARSLLEEVASTLEPGPVRAEILRRLANVRYRNDSCSVAAELLTRALQESADDRSARAGIERDLAWAVASCGDVRNAAEHAQSALRAVHGDTDPEMMPELLAATAMAEFLLGRGIRWDLMRPAVALERPRHDVPVEWRPSMVLGMMLKWSGDLAGARVRFEDLHRQALEAGEETSLAFLLSQMSERATLEGDWATALQQAEEADKHALQTGQDLVRAGVLYAKGLVQAHLGEAEEARETARAGLALSERVGSVLNMMLNQTVLGFVEHSLEDPAAAHGYLAPLPAWLDVVGIREPGVFRFVPDEVEALIALGYLDKAQALLAPYERDAARLDRPSALLAAARCRALHIGATGDASAAAALLEDALNDHGELAQPFERARAWLVMGTIKRRTRQRRAARASLQRALEIFDHLGATLWSARTRRTLGGRADQGSPTAPLLTPAERRVAELVASGGTNREVADRLFVSVRAVEIHLTSTYRKLGIRSRTELALKIVRDQPSVAGT